MRFESGVERLENWRLLVFLDGVAAEGFASEVGGVGVQFLELFPLVQIEVEAASTGELRQVVVLQGSARVEAPVLAQA